MDTFFFIFSRFRRLKSRKGFLSFNFYLSIFLITFSLISIILTDSFTKGYKNEIFSKLNSLNPDFKITKYSNDELSFDDYNLIENDLSSIKEEIVYTPYIDQTAIVFSDNKTSSNNQSYKQREGVYVFGVQNSFLLDNSLIQKYFQNEDFIFSGSSIIIGNYLAKKINKSINDKIDLLFFDASSKNFIAKTFIIQNIYKTQTQNDEFLVYVPLSVLQKLDNENIYCNGFIGDFLNQTEIKSIKLSNKNFVIENWDSQNVLKFLNSFDAPIKLLMWILMFLSVYSLSSLIFNFLIEKKEDLKILYLMGYTKIYLGYIVVSISLYVTIISILIGNFISFLVIYIQNYFQIINLPSEKIFQLTFLPANFDIIYFIKYPIFLIFFTMIISLYVFNVNFKVSSK